MFPPRDFDITRAVPRGSFVLMGGGTLAQAIALALAPVLTRLYSPVDIGVYALYIALVSIISAAASGRYEQAIILPERSYEAKAVVFLAVMLAGATSLLILLVVVVGGDHLAELTGSISIRDWLFLLPLSVFLTAAGQALYAWLIRERNFSGFSITRVMQSASAGGLAALLGIYAVNGGLIFGSIMGLIVACLIGAWFSLRTGFSMSPSWGELVRLCAGRYKDFPKYGATAAAIDLSAGFIPLFAFSWHFDAAATGQFALARQVLAVPLIIVASSISQALARELVDIRTRHDGPLTHAIGAWAGKLALLSVPGLVVLVLWGDSLFAWVFGSQWRTAGEYSQVLILAYAGVFAVSSVSVALPIIGAVRENSAWQVGHAAALCMLFAADVQQVGDFLLLLVVIEIIAYVSYLWLILRYCRRDDAAIPARMARSFVEERMGER